MLAAFLLKFCTFFCMLIKIQRQIVECTADICSLSEPALNLALNMLTTFYYLPFYRHCKNNGYIATQHTSGDSGDNPEIFMRESNPTSSHQCQWITNT